MTETLKLEANNRKKFAKYVSLNILAMLGSSCYIVADTFFVANGVGADGLTALNLGISVFSYVQALALLIAIGSGTRYALCVSRGDDRQGNRVFSTAVALGLGFGILIALAGNLFNRQIAGLLGADASIMGYTATYLQVFMSFAPAFICNHIIVAFVRNDHNPKLATIALLSSNFSNIVLDYVFIYIFDWSMFGAAAATGLAPLISLSILSLHAIKKKNHFHRTKALLPVKEILGFCKLGVSAMVNELSVGLVLMIFNFLFLGIGGNTAVAAYGIVINVGLFGIAIFTGIGQGVQPLVSSSYGKGEREQLAVMRRDTLLVAGVISVILAVVVFLFTSPIAAAFNEDSNPALQAMAEEGLRYYFVSFLFGGANIALAGYLSAMERADMGFIISLLRGLLLIAPGAIILSKLFGATGIWVAVVLTELVTFAVTMYFVKCASKPTASESGLASV